MSEYEEAKTQLQSLVQGDVQELDGDGFLSETTKERLLKRLTTEEMLPTVIEEMGIRFSDFTKALEEDDDFRQRYQLWQMHKSDILRMKGLDYAMAPIPEDIPSNEKSIFLRRSKLIIDQLNVIATAQDKKITHLTPKPTKVTLNLGINT